MVSDVVTSVMRGKFISEFAPHLKPYIVGLFIDLLVAPHVHKVAFFAGQGVHPLLRFLRGCSSLFLIDGRECQKDIWCHLAGITTVLHRKAARMVQA